MNEIWSKCLLPMSGTQLGIIAWNMTLYVTNKTKNGAVGSSNPQALEDVHQVHPKATQSEFKLTLFMSEEVEIEAQRI